MNEPFQAMAIITKVATMVDGGTKLTIDTNELPPQQMTKLFGLKGKAGWVVFKENEVIEADIPEIDSDILESRKTPCQRLRGVLYRLWEQNSQQTYPEFEVYYIAKLERIINQMKEKLQ